MKYCKHCGQSLVSDAKFCKSCGEMVEVEAKKNFFRGIKDFFSRLMKKTVDIAKKFWHLNWEAKIGILLLIPSIIAYIVGIFESIDHYGKEMPAFWGLMAIAGALLINGNPQGKV